ERDRHEVRRVGHARAVVPRALDRPPVAVADGRAVRARPRRRQELAVRAEALRLGALGEQRAELERVPRSEAEAPAGGRAAGRERHHEPPEGGEVELVAAEAPRLERAVEAGVEESLVELLRVEAAP